MTPRTVARQASLSMGMLQARILEWVAMPSSLGSPSFTYLNKIFAKNFMRNIISSPLTLRKGWPITSHRTPEFCNTQCKSLETAFTCYWDTVLKTSKIINCYQLCCFKSYWWERNHLIFVWKILAVWVTLIWTSSLDFQSASKFKTKGFWTQNSTFP